MNVDLKSIVFGAFLGGVFVAAVLSFVAPKSEIGRYEMVNYEREEYLLDTHIGELWRWDGYYKKWVMLGNWNQRR